MIVVGDKVRWLAVDGFTHHHGLVLKRDGDVLTVQMMVPGGRVLRIAVFIVEKIGVDIQPEV